MYQAHTTTTLGAAALASTGFALGYMALVAVGLIVAGIALFKLVRPHGKNRP